MSLEVDKAVVALLGLWDRHKYSSGAVARDVLLFGVEPARYPLDASRLTLLDGGLREAAITVVHFALCENRTLLHRLKRLRVEELHEAWAVDQD